MKQLKMVQIADRLALAKEREATLRDQLKVITDEQDSLKEALLAELDMKRIKSVSSGEFIFTHAKRSGYEITDEESALKWAQESGCVSVNKVKMAKALKGAGALPDGIEYRETDYISVATKKESDT